jgi:hypothetical protein
MKLILFLVYKREHVQYLDRFYLQQKFVITHIYVFFYNFFLSFDFYSFDDIILVIHVFYKKTTGLSHEKKPIKPLEKTHEKTSF